MAVRCEGDCRVMEQLGEKQDFESELSRLGFAHEAFTLDVRHAIKLGSTTNWIANYAVCVTNIASKRRNIYWGGPRKHWVSEFTVDAVAGHYGRADVAPAVVTSPGRVTSVAQRPSHACRRRMREASAGMMAVWHRQAAFATRIGRKCEVNWRVAAAQEYCLA
jgi:hypothetical protein